MERQHAVMESVSVYLKHQNREQFSDLLFDHVGCSVTASDETNGLDRREHDILHYVAEGKGTFSCKNVDYPLSAGCLYLMPRNVTVSYRADHDDPWRVLYVGFYGSKGEDFLHRLGLSADNVALYRPPDDSVLSLYRSMLSEVRQKNPSLTMLAGYFHLIIGTLLQGQAASDDQVETVDLYTVICRYIHSNLDQRLRVHNVAGNFHISQSQLFRIFKQHSGLSLHQYIEATRIEHACHLLTSGSYSIQQVAAQCGYEYESHFYKAFVKRMGVTPARYKKDELAGKMLPAGSIFSQ